MAIHAYVLMVNLNIFLAYKKITHILNAIYEKLDFYGNNCEKCNFISIGKNSIRIYLLLNLDPNVCSSKPCLNSGVCINSDQQTTRGYICQCITTNFFGNNCQCN